MKLLAIGLTSVLCFVPADSLVAQEATGHEHKAQVSDGFAEVIGRCLEGMHGEWRIQSAEILSADLPLEHFESLAVDDAGFTLKVQGRAHRFRFIGFNLEARTFLAKTKSDGYPDGLVYQIQRVGDAVKIRYRADGAHRLPDDGAEDSRLLVQVWKRPPKDPADQ